MCDPMALLFGITSVEGNGNMLHQKDKTNYKAATKGTGATLWRWWMPSDLF